MWMFINEEGFLYHLHKLTCNPCEFIHTHHLHDSITSLASPLRDKPTLLTHRLQLQTLQMTPSESKNLLAFTLQQREWDVFQNNLSVGVFISYSTQ